MYFISAKVFDRHHKERRKDPIMQMGLAMDADGVPLHYELFALAAAARSFSKSSERSGGGCGRCGIIGRHGSIYAHNTKYVVLYLMIND